MVSLGFDPVWFGVIMVVNMEMAVITPPVGINLYILKSLVPELSMDDIIWGTLPYVVTDVIALALIYLFPQIALCFPNMIV